VRALVNAVTATSSISILEYASVEVLTQDQNGAVDGLLVRRGSQLFAQPARAVVLATGGVGGLFAHTTNPAGAVGGGLALGARVGAILRDLEFVQFHPTAIDIGRDPMPLATEALRGEGARLVNAVGDDLMVGVPGGSLAARDVVASVLSDRLALGERVFLQLPAPLLPHLSSRFPGVVRSCASAGIDLTQGRIPVRPAAHYHMGGLKVDHRGRTTIAGLWACGEVASTGLHGANRLASNSLLEAIVGACAIADDLAGLAARLSQRRSGATNVAAMMTGAAASPDRRASLALRGLMDECVGVVRSEDGLRKAIETLRYAAFDATANVELSALMIAFAARSRRETRATHRRADFPLALKTALSAELTLDAVRALAFEGSDADASPMRRAAR
jgi:L-aspartate oxidase